MELDRLSRYLEILLCLLSIVVFYVRMRPVWADAPGDAPALRLKSAMRPIRIGAMVLLAVSVVLWTNARWQPYAHALTIPALLSLGIADAVLRGAGRIAAHR